MIFKKKIERLKNNGLRYDAEILELVSNYIMIGNFVFVHIKCSYQNEKGETCIVKSKSFKLPVCIEFFRKEDMIKNGYYTGKTIKYFYNDGRKIEASVVIVYNNKLGWGYVLYDCATGFFYKNSKKKMKAAVYVSRDNPTDYAVELDIKF